MREAESVPFCDPLYFLPVSRRQLAPHYKENICQVSTLKETLFSTVPHNFLSWADDRCKNLDVLSPLEDPQ